ncbi:MAG: hypothetical protein ACI8VC_002831 [Candidatus Endobugula sp.]|jgi:hypothetical protein
MAYNIYRICLLVLSGLCLFGLWIDYREIPVLDEVDLVPEKIDTVEQPNIPFQLASLIELSEVSTRPLFTDGRQIKPEEDEPSKRNQETKKESRFTMVVTGIVWDGEIYMAILRDTLTRKEQTLYLGSELPDEYTEWRIEKFQGNQVVIKKDWENSEESRNDNIGSSNDGKTKQLSLAEEGVYYTIEGQQPTPRQK